MHLKSLTYDIFVFVLAIYISGDTEVLCGNTARFEAEISTEQDVYMPLNWDRVDGLVREQINIENKKYEGSDTRNLIINNVCMKDKGGYQAVISRKHDVKILSNMVYLRPQGGIYSFKNNLYKSCAKSSWARVIAFQITMLLWKSIIII